MIIGYFARKLVRVLLVVLVLLVVAVIGVSLALNHIVKAGIERVGPLITNVPLEVRDVDISLTGGSFVVEGFRMGNSEGFASPHSFVVESIRVEAELASLLRDEVVMPLIEVEGPEVTLELAGGKSNIGQILRELELPEKEPPEKPGKKVRIGVVRVVDGRVTVAGLPAGQSISLPLPDVEIKDLQAGGESTTPKEAVGGVLRGLYKDIVAAVEAKLPAEKLRTLKGELDETLESGREAVEEGIDKLGEATDELKKGLEDIFK